MESRYSEANESQFQHIARAREAFEAAPKEQPVSALPVVIVYQARLERVEHFMRGGEHVFSFTDVKEDDPNAHFSDERHRNAHAVRDAFLGVKTPIEALDFLSNTGRFSPLDQKITWGEFQRWQRFAYLVQLHTPLMAATIEGQLSGEHVEVLKALTGDSIFRSSFFDIPETPEEFEPFARLLRDPPEMVSGIQAWRRIQEQRQCELWEWFHQPPLSIEWISASKEAEQRAMLHFKEKGFGPWMIEFLLAKKELRPVILIRPAYTLQAIAAAIYADRITGVEYRVCSSCERLIKIRAHGTKAYCDQPRPCKGNAHKARQRERKRSRAGGSQAPQG